MSNEFTLVDWLDLEKAKAATRDLSYLNNPEAMSQALAQAQKKVGQAGESPKATRKGPPWRRNYSHALNWNRTSRSESILTDQQLRDLADACSTWGVLTLLSTGQLATIDWDWQAADEKRSDDPEVLDAIESARAFWKFPNRMDPQGGRFAQFLGTIFEDLDTIGRCCVYAHPTEDGKEIHSFRPIDPASLVEQFNELNELQQPPRPAFLQYLNDGEVGEYTIDQLYSYVTNRRSFQGTGRSPLEYAFSSVLTKVKRDTRNLSRYTEGSIPHLFLMNEGELGWDQFIEAVEEMNERLESNDRELLSSVPLPPGAKPHEVNPFSWSKEEDELLIRMMCAARGVNPMWFVTMMNRATSDTQETAAFDAGLGPRKDIASTICTELEQMRTGKHLIELVMTTDESDITLERAQVLKIFDDQAWGKKSTITRMIGLDAYDGIDELPPGPVTQVPPVDQGRGGVPSFDLSGFIGARREIQPSITVPESLTKAARSELSTWRKLAQKKGTERAMAFVCSAIPEPLEKSIKAELRKSDGEDVAAIFEKAATPARKEEKSPQVEEAERRIREAAAKYLDAIRPDMKRRVREEWNRASR